MKYTLLAHTHASAAALAAADAPPAAWQPDFNVRLRVESADSMFTSGYEAGQLLRIPIAHGEGRYTADAATLDRLEGDGRVLFRYVDQDGATSDDSNPNGSMRSIAGIANETGNVLGLMPHPERAVDRLLGSDDGLALFESLLSRVSA